MWTLLRVVTLPPTISDHATEGQRPIKGNIKEIVDE